MKKRSKSGEKVRKTRKRAKNTCFSRCRFEKPFFQFCAVLHLSVFYMKRHLFFAHNYANQCFFVFFRKPLKTRLFRVFGRFWPFFGLFFDIYALRKCILGRKTGKKGVFEKIVFFGFLCFPFFSKKHVFSVFYALFYMDFLRIMNYKLEKHINIKLVFSVLKTHFENTQKTRIFCEKHVFFGVFRVFSVCVSFFELFVTFFHFLSVFFQIMFFVHIKLSKKEGKTGKKTVFRCFSRFLGVFEKCVFVKRGHILQNHVFVFIFMCFFFLIHKTYIQKSAQKSAKKCVFWFFRFWRSAKIGCFLVFFGCFLGVLETPGKCLFAGLNVSSVK